MRPFGSLVTILNTIDYFGKFDGKADEGFFIGYSLNSKAFRVFNSRTRIVEENLHIRFSENTPNVVGSRPDWLFDIDALTRTMNYEPIVTGTQSNGFADPKSSHDDGYKNSNNDGKKVDEDSRKEDECNDQEKEDNVNNTNNVNTVSSTVDAAGTNEDNELPFDPNMPALEDVSIFNFSNDEKDDDIVADINNMDTTIQKKDGIFISQDKYVAKILKKFGFTEVKNASTPMETQKPLLKDEDGEEVDVHMYRLMIGSLMYLRSSRPDIMFVVCACSGYQDNPKVSHLHVVKRIFSGEAQIHARVDGKKVVFSKASIRRDLQFADEEGVDCLSNSIIFEQLASMRVLDLKKTKTSQSNKIDSLKRKDKQLERRNKSITHKLKRLYKVRMTARVESSDTEESMGEDASKQGWRIDDIDADEDITLVNVQVDAKMFDADKDLGGEEVFVVQEVVADKEKIDGVTLAQALEELKTSKAKTKRVVIQEPKFELDKVQEMFDKAFKRVNTFEDFRIELVQGQKKEKIAREELIQKREKKQKVEDDKETTKLKQLMEIIPNEEEVAIDVIPLAVKSLGIVDWKIYKEGKKIYYQIIRADGKSKMYMFFSQMLESFNMENLEEFYKLVKAKYGSTRPLEDLNLLLWGDLKTMFEPHVEDAIWRKQQGYKVLE
uniref:Copia protein n=1 Tax=Tanacetum cinerariifolium TaxID=118510 RepID=A0A699GM81_TANCI|nr:copia protein [Tanacetum cinerariifolium]